jgi:hypothetical protein
MQAIVGIKKGLPYELEIWDREGLLTEEKRLGIKVDM